MKGKRNQSEIGKGNGETKKTLAKAKVGSSRRRSRRRGFFHKPRFFLLSPSQCQAIGKQTQQNKPDNGFHPTVKKRKGDK
jgi:hypothetical protein